MEFNNLFTDHIFDIIDQTRNGITITNPNLEDNPIIFVNQAFCDIFEYTFDEVVGKNCRFLQLEDRNQENLKIVREAILEQKSVVTVLRNYTKSGTLVYNEIKISPIFDKNTGKLKFFIGIQKDLYNNSIIKSSQNFSSSQDTNTLINELNVFQEELMSQNEELIEKDKYLKVLNNEYLSLFFDAPISYILIDDNLRIKRFNNKSKEYFGFSSDNLYSNSLDKIIANSEMLRFKSWIFTNQYENENLEINLKCSDKEQRRFELHAKKYIINDNLILISLVNIQESFEIKSQLKKKVKKEVERRLEQEKLILKQSKLASMGEMIDAIAHQWLNPLTIVKIYSEDSENLIKEKEFEGCAFVQDNLRVIREQTTHLENTLKEFRSFFRPDVDKNIISAKEIIQSTLVLMEDDLKGNEINITIDVKEDFNINIIANQFKHVLINLLINSRDAFIENQVFNRSITFELYNKSDCNVLEYRDNAGGIPSTIIHKIFESNFTTKKSKNGTGVGLYLCKQILDKFDVNMSVHNLDLGACFLMKFKKSN